MRKSSIVAAALMIVFLLALLCLGLVRMERDRPGEDAVSSSAVVSQEGPYDFGYRRGHDAFCEQFGIVSPMANSRVPSKSFSYASSHAAAGDEGEIERGYVDGYHRAAAMYNCPRGE